MNKQFLRAINPFFCLSDESVRRGNITLVKLLITTSNSRLDNVSIVGHGFFGI